VSRIHPPTTSASLYAANIYINELKNQDSALIMFDRWYQNVNEINEPGPLNSYGMCLSNANRPDEALEIFRKTTAAFQNNEVSYKQAAELLFNQGKKEALLALMNKLEFNIPSSDLPRIYRANLAMRDGNEALAIQYFADALKLKPENSELRQHLIQLYTANGMMEKAAALK
jgi:tetratricopeptide (TPR) repeat protein